MIGTSKEGSHRHATQNAIGLSNACIHGAALSIVCWMSFIGNINESIVTKCLFLFWIHFFCKPTKGQIPILGLIKNVCVYLLCSHWFVCIAGQCTQIRGQGLCVCVYMWVCEGRIESQREGERERERQMEGRWERERERDRAPEEEKVRERELSVTRGPGTEALMLSFSTLVCWRTAVIFQHSPAAR